MRFSYEAILVPSTDGQYSMEVPSLPGCISQGDNLQHSIEMITEAASIWILDELESGRPIPKPRATTEDDLRHFDNPIVRTIEVDIDSFAKKHASPEMVVRSFEIPIWLDTIAAQNHLNLPETLQTAIMQSVR